MLPVEAIFSTACFMSPGATNWPFFTLTARPVLPAATSRSVWRQRKAGIWSTSQASATTAQCAGSCTSVRTGRCVSSAMRRRMRVPSARPGPRKLDDRCAVRFVVGGLEDIGDPEIARRCAWMASAIMRACCSLSMTQGPAMRKSWPPPTGTLPISKSCWGMEERITASRPVGKSANHWSDPCSPMLAPLALGVLKQAGENWEWRSRTGCVAQRCTGSR